MRPDQIRAFIDAYIECALWASHDDGHENFDGYGLYDIHADSLATMKQECLEFMAANGELYGEHGWTDSQAGHDFWLTRNGHGAGFWDRNFGVNEDDIDSRDIGQTLTVAAQACKERYLYLGDDGMIHCCRG